MRTRAQRIRRPLAARRVVAAMLALAVVALGCAAPGGPATGSSGAASPVSDTGASPAAQAASDGAAPRHQLEKVTLGVPAKSLGYLPVYLGRDKGIFAEEGIDLEIVVVPAEVSMAGLLSGSLDYSGASTGAIRAAVAGAPVRTLGFMTIQPTFYIISKPEIRSVADLRQKSIAITSLGSSMIVVARTAVRRAGLDPNEDVQLLTTSTTANSYTALVSGQADAAVLSVPYNVQAEREGFYPLLYAGDITNSPESGLAASLDRIRGSSDQVKRMLRGMLKSMSYVRDRKPETIETIVHEFSIERDLADGAYEIMVRAYSRDGEIAAPAIEEVIRTHRAQTGVAEEFSVEDVTDFGILRQAQRELGL
jgi:ABC-type nitrate/sulfonate/bicarbonate transport system substrate-binding protein